MKHAPKNVVSCFSFSRSTPCTWKRALWLAIAVGTLGASSCSGQKPDTEVGKLKQQIEQLKKENQQLRQLLTQGLPNATAAAGAVKTATAESISADKQELTHWLTLSSNKRHNSNCRWYRASRGRPCSANEGIPCKKCGG